MENSLPVVVVLSVLLADQSSCHEAEKTTTTEHYQHQDQPCSTTATALHKPDNLLWLSLGLRPASGIKTLHALNQSSGSAVEPGVAPLYKVATSPHSLPVDLASSIFNCPLHWLRNFPQRCRWKGNIIFPKSYPRFCGCLMPFAQPLRIGDYVTMSHKTNIEYMWQSCGLVTIESQTGWYSQPSFIFLQTGNFTQQNITNFYKEILFENFQMNEWVFFGPQMPWDHYIIIFYRKYVSQEDMP